jgi:transcription elongation factor Elf1
MTQPLSSPRLTAALLDTPSDTSRLATCPLCHTRHASLTQEALEAGGDWRCIRCGQRWDARRLGTVAAYAAWVAEPESVERRRGSAARQSATPFPGNVPGSDSTEHGDAIFTWDDEGGGSITCEKASGSPG